MTPTPANSSDASRPEQAVKKKKSMLISWIYVTLSLIAASSVLYILFREMIKEISYLPQPERIAAVLMLGAEG